MGSVFYGTSMAFRLGIVGAFAKYIHAAGEKMIDLTEITAGFWILFTV